MATVRTNGVHIGAVLFLLVAMAFFVYELPYWLGRGMERTPERDRLMQWAGSGP
jgi:hypothetical protein